MVRHGIREDKSPGRKEEKKGEKTQSLKIYIKEKKEEEEDEKNRGIEEKPAKEKISCHVLSKIYAFVQQQQQPRRTGY